MSIPMEKWGRDHASTVLYLETCLVDCNGKLDPRKMRINRNIHPGTGNSISSESPTQLSVGVVHKHDDWSCLEDAEAAGICVSVGTGINPHYNLTDEGWELIGFLRRRRAENRKAFSFTQYMAERKKR